MKKSILMMTGCVAMLSIASIAYSAGSPYMSANAGLSVPTDVDMTDPTLPGITLDVESDTGFAFGVAAGYDLGNNVRVEGEIAYQQNDLDKANLLGIDVDLSGDSSSLALLLNGYYDFANQSAFTPFISAGLGAARVEINDFNVAGSGVPSESDDDTVFAYQLGAGISYAINDQIDLDIKYRYFGTSDPEFDSTTSEYSSHNFYAGMRFSF